MVETHTKGANAGNGAAEPRLRPSGLGAIFNRARALTWVTTRTIIFDRKTIVIGVILLLALAIPLYWLRDPPIDEENAKLNLYMMLMVVLYLQFIVLYASLLFGAGLLTTEVEDRTMTYLISRRIPRFEILLYKYIGYVVGVFTIFIIPATLNYLILTAPDGLDNVVDNLDLLGYTLGGILMGIMAWGALFMFLAAAFKNPLMPGFFYCLFWESFMANIPESNVAKATITYQIRTFIFKGVELLREQMENSHEGPPYGDYVVEWAFAATTAVAMVFLLLTWFKVRRKDFH